MKNFISRWCTITAVSVLVATAAPTRVQTQQTPPRAPDLATLFAPGGILQDRNGDGVIDFVNAHIVLSQTPDAADVSAAADIAARLGFETMAMNLPLPTEGAGATTSIVVGRDSAAPVRMAPTVPLRAGEGTVVAMPVSGQPAIMVLGADGAGTMAAAELLAGRLPH